MLLSMMKPGDAGEIVEILGDGELRQRLLDIGFLPGRIVKIIRFAPLGDPVEVEILGTSISLRGNEAALIRVKPFRGKRMHRRRKRWI